MVLVTMSKCYKLHLLFQDNMPANGRPPKWGIPEQWYLVQWLDVRGRCLDTPRYALEGCISNINC